MPKHAPNSKTSSGSVEYALPSRKSAPIIKVHGFRFLQVHGCSMLPPFIDTLSTNSFRTSPLFWSLTSTHVTVERTSFSSVFASILGAANITWRNSSANSRLLRQKEGLAHGTKNSSWIACTPVLSPVARTNIAPPGECSL